MDRLLFISSNALALSAAWSLSRIALPGAFGIERALAVCAGVPVVVLPLLLSFGAVGALHATTVTAAVGALALALGVWSRRLPRPSAPNARADVASSATVALTGVLLGLLATKLLPLVERHALRGMKLHWDDFSYHAPMPAHWIQAHELVLAPFNYHAYYPGNAELFTLWFMLPTRLDAFASLATLFWLLLAAGAVAGLARALGASAAAATFGAAALFACTPFAEQASSFAAVDLAGTALCGAALAIAIGAHDGRDLLGRAFYVACLVGLAIGAKISFVPLGLAAIACVLFALVGQSKRTFFIALALGAVCLVACGSYWYARNLVLTGNPLFPAEVAFFEGPLDARAQRQTTLWFQLQKLEAKGLDKAWKELFAWPRSIAYLWLAGYASTFLLLLRPRAWRESGNRRAALLLVVGVLVAAIVCVTPFSGTVNAKFAPLQIRLRFFLPIAWLGLPLAAWALEQVRPLRHLLVAAAAVYLVHAAGLWTLPTLAATLAGAGVLLAARRAPERLVARAAPIAGVLLCLVLPVAAERAMVVKQPGHEKAFTTAIPAWKALDSLPPGARVAWFSTFEGYKYYPAFGYRLARVPVAVEPDGRRYVFLHEDWRELRKSWWQWKGRKRNMDKLVSNLQAQRIRYVFLMKRHTGDWPKQFELLRKSNRAKLVLKKKSLALFTIEPA